MSGYDPDNIFAKMIRGDIPCTKVFEDDVVLVCMDIMPQSRGHCLVIPKAGSRNLLDADAKVLGAVMERVQMIAQAAQKSLGADGVRIMQFNEEAAGQTVFHLHFHVMPIYKGEPLLPHSGSVVAATDLTRTAETIKAALSW